MKDNIATLQLVKSYLEEQQNWGLDESFLSGKTTGCSKSAELDELYEKIKDCQRCPLGKTRNKFVFGVGNPESKLMFVGEGPGYDEDRLGEPFVGKAGQLLNKIIEAMGLKRKDVYIANITKCHPMKDPLNPQKRGNDRPPTKDEMASCIPYLKKQIEIIKPEVICALGTTAAQGLLNTDQTIGNLRGRIFDLYITEELKVKVIPTYHPAALLRDPSLKKTTWQDIKIIMKLLNIT